MASAVLVLLEAGLAAVALDVVRLMTKPEFEAPRGDSLDRPRRRLPGHLPADVDRLEHHQADAVLSGGDRPRGGARASPATWRWCRGFGAIGAAWTNAAAYAVQALAAFVLSQRVYPIPLEWGRLARLAAAGAVAWGLATLPPASMAPLTGLLVRGAIVCVTYPLVLLTLGFYDGREVRAMGRLVARMRTRRANVPEVPAALDGPVEAGGAIIEVPLVQDDLRDDEIVLQRPAVNRPAPGPTDAG